MQYIARNGDMNGDVFEIIGSVYKQCKFKGRSLNARDFEVFNIAVGLTFTCITGIIQLRIV